MPKGHNEHHAENTDKGTVNPFSEFLNPNSMITPGAAGAFTMVVTNTLCQQFTQLPLNFTGLAVSFLFGAIVFGYGASLPLRVMYYAINSLIIFVVAVGSNAVGVGIDKHLDEQPNIATVGSVSDPPALFLLAASTDRPDQQQTRQDAQQKGRQGQQEAPTDKPKFFRHWF